MNQRMSNKKFMIIWIPIVAFFVILTIVTTVAAGIFSPVFDIYLGRGERHVVKQAGTEEWDTEYYEKKYETLAEAKDASLTVQEKVTDEGAVLLKNNGVLPIARGSTITPFGRGYTNPVYNMAANNGSGKYSSNANSITPAQGLTNYFTINSAAVNKMPSTGTPASPAAAAGTISTSGSFGGDSRIYEWDPAIYSGIESGVQNTTGIVIISRTGQEGSDKKYDGYADGTPHYLALSANEKETVRFAKENCGKVVLVINSSAAMELTQYMSGELEADAIVWIGHPGQRGFFSLGRVLCGEVNPSGRTVDIFSSDFTKDPSYKNFGSFHYNNSTFATKAITESPPYRPGGSSGPWYRMYMEYEEDMYNGYRYYETAPVMDSAFVYGELDGKGGVKTAGAVCYPFGYGLSYTSFKQSIVSYSDSGDNITMTVKVENTGARSGKNVVQLYYTPPYTNMDKTMKIEKPAVTLAAFTKTDMIAKGQSEDVTLTFAKEEMASYCYTRDNGDGTKGCYMLEEGDYVISLRNNSHDVIDSRTWKKTNGTMWYDSNNPRKSEIDAQSAMDDNGNILPVHAKKQFDNTVEAKYTAAVNLFQSSSDYMNEEAKLFTRTDWKNTFPSGAAPREKAVGDKFNALFGIEDTFNVETDPQLGNVPGSKVYSGVMPASGKDNGLMASDMRGRDYYDPLWDDILDQIDWEADKTNIQTLIGGANYYTKPIDSISLPQSVHCEGANGIRIDNNLDATATYCMPPVMAATYNTELMKEMGEALGQEALLAERHGWYAPPMNIHRSPFSGRNFEYYSEDPLLSGKIGAAVVSGVGNQGLYCNIKHFGLNDQETHRSMLIHVWATEQAMREIYCRQFEIVMKEARKTIRYTADANGMVAAKVMRASTGLMAAQNDVGPTIAHGNYNLLTGLVRTEWGFNGTIITDMYGWVRDYSATPDPKYDNMRDMMLRAGCDNWLLTGALKSGMIDYESATSRSVMRNMIHHVAYTLVNSSVMQDTPPGSTSYYDISPWRIWLVIMNAVVYAATAAMSALTVLRVLHAKKFPDRFKH